MPILNCHVDDRTLATLERVSVQTGRTVEDLAEAAISEAAVMARRDEPSAGRAALEQGNG